MKANTHVCRQPYENIGILQCGGHMVPYVGDQCQYNYTKGGGES
jgi:hypothetical protein